MTHRLTRALKHYCPQVLRWFEEKATGIFGDCLRRWPTLKAVPRARRATLAAFCRAHHGRAAEVITHRLQAITAATPLTPAAGSMTPHALVGQVLVAQLRVT
jgi:hypothetical protein